MYSYVRHVCRVVKSLFKMPKVSNLKKYVIEYGENVFSTDDDILLYYYFVWRFLLYKVCETKVYGNKVCRYTAFRNKQT